MPLAEYLRSPTMPEFVDECDYECNGTATANDVLSRHRGLLLILCLTAGVGLR